MHGQQCDQITGLKVAQPVKLKSKLVFSVLLSRYDVSCDVYYQRKDDVKESVERCRVIDPTLFLDVERLLEEADAVGRLISGLKDFLALEKVANDALKLFDLVDVLQNAI